MRKIKVFSTIGSTVEFDASENITLSDLLDLFAKYNVQYNGMKIMVSPGKVTLEHPEAVVPAGNLLVSLTPFKTKAGATPSYNEMKAFVRDTRLGAIQNGDASIVELIGDYTRLSSGEMANLYNQLVQIVESNAITVVTEDAFRRTINGLETRVQVLENRLNRLNERFDDEFGEDDFEENDDQDCQEEDVPEEIKELRGWASHN